MRLKSRTQIQTILFGSMLMTACGPTLEEGADARIRVTPSNQITFSRVTPGTSRSLPFVVTSVGRDTLDVRKIEWDGSDAITLTATGSAFPRALSPQTSMPISVEFAPTVKSPAPNGTIRIFSNDPETPIYSLDVTAQQLAPVIHVVPSSEEKLIFGQTDVGNTSSQKVLVSNVGDLPLEISSVSLVSSQSFSYTTAATLPVTLPANSNSTLALSVDFAPQAKGKQEASLVIHSNDPAHPEYKLPIIANSDSPCLNIQPALLEFSPSVSVGTSQTRQVQLTSCSSVPLTISEVLKTSGDNAFTHQLKNAGKELKNGESAVIDITYSPTAEGASQAAYTIINDDPLQPNAQLTVMGTASTNQCPKAVIQGRLSSASTWSKTLDLSPLDTVILDGSQSSDKESTTLKYYWNIESAPKDSTAAIANDGDKASFFLDLAGSYKLCLTVEDTGGMMSCNTDCVTITAIPRETIHVQLVWHTPKDKIIGDNDGTDLDLHFLTYPDGHWGGRGVAELNNGTDIYFKNPSAVWNIPGQGQEYPSLDIDDQDGEGPENISLDHPTPCRWYAIGVHYYKDNGFYESYATVRSYIDGKLIFEKPTISFPHDSMFKQVAWLFWTGDQAYFYETDLAYEGDSWIGLSPVPDKDSMGTDIMNDAKTLAPQCFK